MNIGFLLYLSRNIDSISSYLDIKIPKHAIKQSFDKINNQFFDKEMTKRLSFNK